MCQIMGIDMVHDPDPTYELTADNVKKMMAIYMRFRWAIQSCNPSQCVRINAMREVSHFLTEAQEFLGVKFAYFNYCIVAD